MLIALSFKTCDICGIMQW